MGLTLPEFGDAEPGVKTTDEHWRAGGTVVEHGR